MNRPIYLFWYFLFGLIAIFVTVRNLFPRNEVDTINVNVNEVKRGIDIIGILGLPIGSLVKIRFKIDDNKYVITFIDNENVLNKNISIELIPFPYDGSPLHNKNDQMWDWCFDKNPKDIIIKSYRNGDEFEAVGSETIFTNPGHANLSSDRFAKEIESKGIDQLIGKNGFGYAYVPKLNVLFLRKLNKDK